MELIGRGQARTIKFMNKLNQLKSREGFEGFGSIISLFRCEC